MQGEYPGDGVNESVTVASERQRREAIAELRAFAREVKMRLEMLDQQAPPDWYVKPTQCDAYVWAQRILAEEESS
jgi:hypothetical protein